MTTINSKLLVALESIRDSGQLSAQRDILEVLRSHVASLGETDIVDPNGAALLKAFVTGLSRVATSDHANTLLTTQHITLVGADICNACAVREGESTTIFVFQGLVKAIMFFLEFGDIVYALDTAINDENTRIAIPQEGLATLVSQAYASLYHYMATTEPLIRVGKSIPVTAKASLMIRFARVLWFILMHEIGHIQLGHLSSSSSDAVVAPPALICPEDLNSSKLQEFEADLYLCDTLKDAEQYALMSYVLAPLDMFASFERNLGPPRQTHPMAVNRLQNILSNRRVFLDERSVTIAEEIIARDYLAINPIQLMRDNYSPRATNDEAAAAVHILQELYASLPVPSTVTAKEVEQAELWDFTVEYFWTARFEGY